jgi:hypothetical protein
MWRHSNAKFNQIERLEDVSSLSVTAGDAPEMVVKCLDQNLGDIDEGKFGLTKHQKSSDQRGSFQTHCSKFIHPRDSC